MYFPFKLSHANKNVSNQVAWMVRVHWESCVSGGFTPSHKQDKASSSNFLERENMKGICSGLLQANYRVFLLSSFASFGHADTLYLSKATCTDGCYLHFYAHYLCDCGNTWAGDTSTPVTAHTVREKEVGGKAETAGACQLLAWLWLRMKMKQMRHSSVATNHVNYQLL